MITYLPGIYIDDVSFDDDSSSLILLNRHPEPNQVAVPSDLDPLVIEIHETSSVGLDVSSINVSVGGIVAIEDGIFVNDWSGTITPQSSPGSSGNDITRIEMHSPDPFDSLATLTIHVEAALVGLVDEIDESYSFTVEDLTPPELVAAIATGQRTVKVTFDEPVRMLGDGAANDALSAGNYSFEALNDEITPAVSLVAESVTGISTTEVEVTTDIEMTPGVEYRLTVTGVEDVFGNPI